MSACCICGKELDIYRLNMPFAGDCQQFVMCQDCYARKIAMESGVVDKYLSAREYLMYCIEQGSVHPGILSRLETYIQEQDGNNEDAMIEYEIRKKYDSYVNGNKEALQQILNSFLLTTSNSFEGFRIKRYITLVSGETALGTGIFSEWAINLAEMSGGESGQIENKLIEAKKSAQSKMIRRAIGCGANAVLGIKFDVTSLTSGLLMVSINGTAVEVEKI